MKKNVYLCNPIGGRCGFFRGGGKIDFQKIEDKSDRMQVKLGLISLLFLNLAD